MSGPATRRQIGKLHAVLTGLGITERPEKLRVVGAAVWRSIESTNDLTFDEASVAINTLQSIAERDDPKAALAVLIGQVAT